MKNLSQLKLELINSKETKNTKNTIFRWTESFNSRIETERVATITRSHSKSSFAQNFWPPSALVHPSSFCIYPVPPQPICSFYELHSPSQKKLPDAYEFSNKNSGSEMRENNFLRLNIKDQCFLPSYIYNDNKNIYMFMKKRWMKKTSMHCYMLD